MRAIANFNKMIPQLRAYTRQLTGDPKINLVAGSYSHTDGKTIHIRPPLSLAGKQVHRRGMCEVFVNGESQCQACWTKQFLMVTLQHEIGHCLNGSFEAFNTMKVSQLTAEWKKMGLEFKYADKMYQAAVKHIGTEAFPMVAMMHLSGSLHLPHINLLCEDIRCNEQMFLRDPSLRKEFAARDIRILEDGIERDDGSLMIHSDAPHDTQLTIGMYMKAFGHDIDYHFDEEVVKILKAPGAQRLADKLRTAADVFDTATLSVEFYLWGKTHGMFEEPDPKDQEELDEMIEELMKWITALIGHDHRGASGFGSGDGPGEEGHSHGSNGMGGLGGDANQEGERTSEADLTKAIEALLSLDRVPLNVGPPKITEHPDRRGWGEQNGQIRHMLRAEHFTLPETVLGAATTAARVAFGTNRRAQVTRNMRSGKLVSKSLARRVPFGDDRVFGKKIEPSKRDYLVVIGMDCSGSTSGQTLQDEKMAVLAQAEVCNRVGVKFEIWAHSTYGGYGEGEQSGPEMLKIKGAEEPWNGKAKDKLRTLRSMSGNLDGHSLQFYRKRLDEGRATDKVLMYYTDGAMPASNYDEEKEVLEAEVKVCATRGYTLMAVGMGTTSPKAFGMDTVEVNGHQDYRKVVDHLGKRLLK